MAWEYPVLDLPGQTASVAFDGTGTTAGYQSKGQFLLCKLTGDNAWAPCSSTLDMPAGISQTNPKVGDALQIRVMGVSKVMVGSGGLTAATPYGTDANGLAIAKGVTATGGNFGQFCLGYCIEGAAAGALATVMVQPPWQV